MLLYMIIYPLQTGVRIGLGDGFRNIVLNEALERKFS